MKIILTVLALAILSACVTAESSFKEKGLSRAAFDLGCPAEKIELNVLVRNDGLGCAGSQMGVTGCGKKAVYVCDHLQNWIMNSDATPAIDVNSIESTGTGVLK
jgi:hypothetical protein